MAVSKIFLQVSDLAEILVYALLLKVSTLILKNIPCYEELCCMAFTVTCVHIMLQEQLILSPLQRHCLNQAHLYECLQAD